MIERIILHAGTPKTGTTALQVALNARRAELMEGGLLYPAMGVPPHPPAHGQWMPKHQWLVVGLMSGSPDTLLEQLKAAGDEAPPGCTTMLLSTEGLYNHWWDFTDAGRAVLSQLARTFQVEFWAWFRDPVSYVASLYIQALKNPQNGRNGNGIDRSPELMLDEPGFARRIDYAAFLDDVRVRLGSGAIIRPFAYRGSTVHDAFAHLGLDFAQDAEPRVHASVGEVGVEMLRVLNRRPLTSERKAAAVERICRLDAELGRASGPFRLAPDTEARVLALTARSLDRLRREHGLDLGRADSRAGQTCSPT